MAAPVLEGSHSFSAASDSGSETGITIPSGTDCIVVFASIESVTGSGDKMSELCWDAGGTVDFIEGKFQISDDYTGSAIMCWVMTSGTALNSGWPGTGSGKELSYTHDQTPGEDTKFWIGFFSGVDDTNPVEASWSATDEDTNTNVTETSAMTGVSADSYSIMGSYYWDAAGNPVGAPSGYGQTQRYDSNSGSDNQLLLSDEVGETALRQEQLDYPISVAIALAAGGATSYTLTASGGSYTLTGTAAGLEYNREIAAAAGSFSVSGTSADLEHDRAIDAEAGAYALTGAAAVLEYNPAIDADAGAFSLTGQDATLTYAGSTTMTAEAGAYVVTGTAANLEHNRELNAEAGAYSIAGQDATLTYTQADTLNADAGAFTITGTAAGLEYARIMAADGGSVALAGQDATLIKGQRVSADAGELSVSGADADLLRSLLVGAEAGDIAWTGFAATLQWSGELIPQGRVQATLTARQPGATLTARQPGITLTAT